MKLRILAVATLALLLLLAVVWWLGLTQEEPRTSGESAAASSESRGLHGDGLQSHGDPSEADGGHGSTREESALQKKLQSLVADLSGQTEVERVKEILARLKAAVHAASPDEAARQLIEMLESGIDQATGLDFIVGAEGVMDETPTLRTALLDLLGQTDPYMSADYARHILATTNSPDEYALALRNLGWTNTGGALDSELHGYFEQMLGRSDWSANPTDGFLEAFDLAVVTKAVPSLASRIAHPVGGEAGDHQSDAAFLAMDRIMVSDPGAVVAAFKENPAFLAEAPTHRASLLSRLDVRQPEQSNLLREYLLRPDVKQDEMEYFVSIFPNGNRVVGHRLVTTDEPGGSASDVALIDRATLGTLTAWLNDPQMAARQSEIQTMVKRLQDFVGIPAASLGH